MADQMIDIDYLKQLLEIFDGSTVNDLRIEREGTEIRLSKSPRREETGTTTVHYAPMAAAPATAPAPVAAPTPAAETAAPAAADEAEKELHVITSPIVGTYYASPSPDSEPFVEVGSRVHVGSVLCIIEAMKLMNEIECDIAGTVVRIFPENAQPVEFGQPLYQIKPG